MPNNKRSKLFMKTWPPPKTKKDNDRPLTATLDKPNVLNISFIDKVDMTRMGEELLAIRNLCLIPWSDGAKNGNARKRPLSAIGVKSSSGDDCNNNGKDYINRRLKNNRTQLNRTRSPPKSLTRSTKLPEPCKSCGRSDQPERLHSHPKTSLAHRTLAIKDMDIKLPVKNIVQKPVAIKYRPRHSENAPRTCEKIKLGQLQQGMTSNSIPAKRTLTCYLCAREFGTASLPLHEPKCLERWHRQNDTLPKHLRRNPPPKPSGNLTKEEWDEYAWNASKMSLVPCDNCKRTFLPDRLLVHQRSCKPQRVSMSASSGNTKKELSSDLPVGVVCDICGKLFGTKSIKIHRPQCLKKHQLDEKLKPTISNSPQSARVSNASLQEQVSQLEMRPPSPKKPPMFPCYLCGRLFSVNSIYIHEPQCLKKWKAENEKLPPNKRKKEPLKPDIKFTPSGGVDFQGTMDRIWDNHLAELVECRFCGRKFFANRIETHENACNKTNKRFA